MENRTVPDIFLTTPIDTSYVQTVSRRSSLDDLRRCDSPVESFTESLLGIYCRSRPMSPSVDGECERMSLYDDEFPGFDYSGFTRQALKKIRREEGSRNLSMGINLPTNFSTSSSTLATVELHEEGSAGSGDRTSQDTLNDGYRYFVTRPLAQPLGNNPIGLPRVHFAKVAKEDSHGRSMHRKDSDAKSIASSVGSTSSRLTIKPLRAVQRVVSKFDSKASKIDSPLANPDPFTSMDIKSTSRKRAPSVYKVIRKSVVKALTSKAKPKVDASPTTTTSAHYRFDPPHGTPVVNPVSEFPHAARSGHVRSSSASVFSFGLKRRPTGESQKTVEGDSPAKRNRAFSIRSRHAAPRARQDAAQSAAKLEPRLLNRPLQRSRSFSAFGDFSVVPERQNLGEEVVVDRAMDTMRRLNGHWPVYVPHVPHDAMEDGFLFERNVEVM
ncbi:unnamed protein product [Cyclocybe aegerita]|uniref:Uncharacterized protein n=1 Tax=Cyclocybe aegerita TaxID=1973307 RepID=A0A8S0Y0V5_CYCAE|nr:unnamed protein product [Cyclocybe aegerita]